jgi:hypothetical protein
MAMASNRKISGAAEIIHLTVSTARALQQLAQNLVRENRRRLIQINPGRWQAVAYGTAQDTGSRFSFLNATYW